MTQPACGEVATRILTWFEVFFSNFDFHMHTLLQLALRVITFFLLFGKQ